jgi:hypothetical protein
VCPYLCCEHAVDGHTVPPSYHARIDILQWNSGKGGRTAVAPVAGVNTPRLWPRSFCLELDLLLVARAAVR